MASADLPCDPTLPSSRDGAAKAAAGGGAVSPVGVHLAVSPSGSLGSGSAGRSGSGGGGSGSGGGGVGGGGRNGGTVAASVGWLTLCCGHVCHGGCIARWAALCPTTPACPVCQTPMGAPLWEVVVIK